VVGVFVLHRFSKILSFDESKHLNSWHGVLSNDNNFISPSPRNHTITVLKLVPS